MVNPGMYYLILLFSWKGGSLFLQLIEIIIVFTIVLPTSILIHELGHALSIISFSKKAEADIFFGSRSKERKLKFKIGRVNFYITMAFSGFCFVSNLDKIPPLSYKQSLIIDIGGPLASLIASLFFYMCSFLFTGELSSFFNNFAIINLLLLLLSALPFKYSSIDKHLAGYSSDGLRILNLLKEMRKNKTIV